MSQNPKLQFSILATLIFTIGSAIFAYLISEYGGKAIGPWAVFAAFAFVLFLIGSWLARGVTLAGDNDPTSPQKLETFNDNMQASALVARLQEIGVQATAVGGFVSGFQAESPGYVDVVVPKSDFEKAKAFLAELANQDAS